MTPQFKRRVVAVLTVLLVCTGLGLAPSPVAAADCPDQPCVVVTYVQTVDGRTTPLAERVFTATEIRQLAAADPALKDRRYSLRKNPASKGGKIDDRPKAQGDRVGINRLLTETDATRAASSTYLETPNASGIPSVLSPDELAAPPSSLPSPTGETPSPTGETPTPTPPTPTGETKPYPFYDNLQPVVFLSGSGKLGFIRPLRDFDEDVNATDYFQVAGPLVLTVHTTGRLLAPSVASSKGTDLAIGAKTTFSVAYANKPRSRVLRTTWDFGDGSTKATKREKPSKAYARKGTYPVAVSVRTNDGSYGRSAPVEIKVAKPPKAPTSGPGGGDGLGGSGGSGGSGGTLPPPFDPFEGDVDQPGMLEEPPFEQEDPPTPLPVDEGLEPVEGYVLAGAEIAPGGTPETIPGTQNSTAPAPATQTPVRQRVATWVVATLAVAALVGLGAASETRWFRTRLRHLRRRA